MDYSEMMPLILLPVVGWLCLNAFNQSRKIAVMEASLKVIEAKVDYISTSLNAFVKTETQALMEIVEGLKK